MKITQQQAKEYYDKLTDAQKVLAFCDMVDYLADEEAMRANEYGEIYWSSCGRRLGKSE